MFDLPAGPEFGELRGAADRRERDADALEPADVEE